MSFLHTHSSECIKSELDFFSLPPTQTSIESLQWIYYKPVTSLTDDSPIEFVIPGHGEDYLDLTHTMLSLRIRLESERRESTSVTAAEVAKVGPVNHLLHSMFNQIDVYFNQKLVSPPNNAYAYRAYIEALLNYASPAKTSHLTSCLMGRGKQRRLRLRLEVRFEKGLSVTINCIVYAEFDNVLEIDSSRQVIVDFSG
ncbi:Uncharacterized protein F54H12.2 [Trachymyrmex cornetzi]|uniref:Uncharacterized protein F54H12.2 n=1 Tax=Trachymyrmex cornetzi TaxID=471704 RepID=A0A151JAE9_9HYME|nr:Uncharacterized protein F54H12.2 [Trachymyrmex cornetzi]